MSYSTSPTATCSVRERKWADQNRVSSEEQALGSVGLTAAFGGRGIVTFAVGGAGSVGLSVGFITLVGAAVTVSLDETVRVAVLNAVTVVPDAIPL